MTAGTTHFGELPAAMGPVGDPDARFSEAMRHSRRVRFLRRAIPIGAVLGISAIFFIAIYEPFRMLPDGVSIGDVQPERHQDHDGAAPSHRVQEGQPAL